MRWVQSALNDVLGLQLPTHGIADPATRGAIRSFQQQKGLPVDGVVGPDTEHALAAARANASPSVPPALDMGPPAVGSPPPAATAPPSMPDMTAAAQQGPPSPSTPGSPPGMTGGGTQEFDFEWENFTTIDTPIPAGCAPEPGEVAASHTPAGILKKDDESTDKGILAQTSASIGGMSKTPQRASSSLGFTNSKRSLTSRRSLSMAIRTVSDLATRATTHGFERTVHAAFSTSSARSQIL
jgi:hypothetical protein